MKIHRLPQNTALLWLGLCLFFLLSIWILLPIQPNDYWWYVRLGGDIVRQGAIPSVDTFSYTQTGQPMTYHSWLSALIFWFSHESGGFLLTALLRAGLLLSFYLLIWQTCRLAGAGPKLATVLVFIIALAGSNQWAMRPQLFSYPIFGLMVWLVWRWQKGEIGLLWLLPLSMILWVNLHGAFILGFLLVGAAWVGGDGPRWPLFWAFVGMGLASLLNPRHIEAWYYVLTLLTDPPSQQLGFEWQSPTTKIWQGSLFFICLLLFAPLNALSPQKLSLTHWLWFLGFGWMALSGLRYVTWFLTILAPLMAYLAGPFLNRILDGRLVRGIPCLNGLLFYGFLLCPLIFLPGLRDQWWTDSPPPLSYDTPVEATQWLAFQPDLAGPLWSDLIFSSYLIHALPERPVWIDTRFELYPLEQWQDYIAIADGSPRWSDLLDEAGVNLVMLNQQKQENLLLALHKTDHWCEIYRDEIAVLFWRCKIYCERE